MLIQSMKREIKDKESLLEKQQSLVQSLGDSNTQLQDQISQLKQSNAKLEAKVETTKDEIGKGNQIIQKLQQ